MERGFTVSIHQTSTKIMNILLISSISGLLSNPAFLAQEIKNRGTATRHDDK
jgi:hypothetical protein